LDSQRPPYTSLYRAVPGPAEGTRRRPQRNQPRITDPVPASQPTGPPRRRNSAGPSGASPAGIIRVTALMSGAVVGHSGVGGATRRAPTSRRDSSHAGLNDQCRCRGWSPVLPASISVPARQPRCLSRVAPSLQAAPGQPPGWRKQPGRRRKSFQQRLVLRRLGRNRKPAEAGGRLTRPARPRVPARGALPGTCQPTPPPTRVYNRAFRATPEA